MNRSLAQKLTSWVHISQQSSKWIRNISGALNLEDVNNLYKSKLQADYPDINPEGNVKAKETIEEVSDDNIKDSTTKRDTSWTKNR